MRYQYRYRTQQMSVTVGQLNRMASLSNTFNSLPVLFFFPIYFQWPLSEYATARREYFTAIHDSSFEKNTASL